jgi:hypothetical protein
MHMGSHLRGECRQQPLWHAISPVIVLIAIGFVPLSQMHLNGTCYAGKCRAVSLKIVRKSARKYSLGLPLVDSWFRLILNSSNPEYVDEVGCLAVHSKDGRETRSIGN